MENIYQKNLNFFLKTHPQLKSILNIKSDNYILDKAKDGNYTLMDKSGNYIHSKYSPRKEAERKVKELNIEDKSLIISAGNGLGYVLEELSVLNEIIVIIIEPNIECFIKSLHVIDYEEILKKISVYFCFDIDSIQKTIEKTFNILQTKKIVTIVNETEFKTSEKLLDDILEKIKYTIDENISFSLVVSKFGKLWFENFIKNIKNINEYYLFNELEKIKGKSLIIGSGPTLKNNIKEIKRLSEYYYTFAADSAYEICKNEGIDIDFTGSFDPQQKVIKFINSNRDLQDKKESIIMDTISACGLYKKFNNIILLPTDHPLNKWLYKRGHISSIFTGTGGSVVIPMINFAINMGITEFILAGLDFGYVNNNSYYKGVLNYNDDYYVMNKFSNSFINKVIDKNIIEVETVDGSRIKTTQNLDLYRRQLNNLIDSNDNIKFYQGSLKSARLNKTEYIELAKIETKEKKSQLRFSKTKRKMNFNKIKNDFIEDLENVIDKNIIDSENLIEMNRVLETIIYNNVLEKKRENIDELKREAKEYIITLFYQ